MKLKRGTRNNPKNILVLTTWLVGVASCSSPTLDKSKIARTPANDVDHTRCGNLSAPISRGDIECLTQELIEFKYPELQNAWELGRIKFKSFQSRAYFLKTSFLAGQINCDRTKRTYSIDVNDSIYDTAQEPAGAPSVEAIQGILAHELVHLVDYEKAGLGGTVRLGVNIVIHPSRIERATDEVAFLRGFAPGIKKYREWIYGKLTPKDLKRKMKRYYTPEEIDRWIDQHTSD